VASHTAIAAVSRTVQTLLLDRMVTGAAITLAPPDVEVAGVNGARVNLYLMQVIENGALKNQEIPGRGHPAEYGHPPLSLDLRYLVTSHSAMENQVGADLNAQTILGDAMRVMNDFGNRIDHLVITNPVAGIVGHPILDPDLTREFERLKIVLHPASLDDITKVWSAVSGTNFRRSVVYEVTVIQIETPAPRVRPQPVEMRRIFATVRKRPEIVDAYVSPTAPGDPIGETRVRVNEEITIVAQGTLADRLYVRLGSLEPIRVSPPGDGRIRIVVPNAQYPIDLDHPAVRPIPAAAQLQPGPLEVQVIAVHPAEGVQGGLGTGTPVPAGLRRYPSNSLLMQLIPRVTAANPPTGNAATILHVTGQRLWNAGARTVEVIVGDAAIPVTAPTPTAVDVPMSAAAGLLEISAVPYPVAVQVDGARSRDLGITFTLGP
jgi:uncharacterized protein DUF4255